jgi:hypothetical protein
MTPPTEIEKNDNDLLKYLQETEIKNSKNNIGVSFTLSPRSPISPRLISSLVYSNIKHY